MNEVSAMIRSFTKYALSRLTKFYRSLTIPIPVLDRTEFKSKIWTDPYPKIFRNQYIDNENDSYEMILPSHAGKFSKIGDRYCLAVDSTVVEVVRIWRIGDKCGLILKEIES